MAERVGKGLMVTLTIVVLAWISQAESASEVTLVHQGEARVAILLGKNSSRIEQHSAEELAKYVKAMSGAELRIVRETEIDRLKGNDIVLIGRAETNEKIKELSKKGLVKLSPQYPGLDGFIIKTVTDKGRNYLILGGSIDRGTLYAVYHLLEKQLNVGFFEDGDRIPKIKSIVVDCNIAERPYFAVRGSLISGPSSSRNAAFWGEKEWKQEIDWLLKKKCNIMLNVKGKWMLDYGRERGMRFIYGGYDGGVSSSFMRAHPEVRYITIYSPWSATTASYIDPRDPFFVTYATERNKAAIKDDPGTGHFFMANPWAEVQMPGKDEEERRQILTAFARAISQALVNADPQAVNIMHGWAFGYPQFWSSENVKAYLDAMVSDVIVMDMKADRGDPIYKQHNYFWDKKWLFCIMDGGEWQGIGGDTRDLIRALQEVATDPKTQNCVGTYSSSESLRYNFLYYDLLHTLSWDPRKVEMEDFLRDYASRRYGMESVETMQLCLEKLADTVYRRRDLADMRHVQRLPYPYVPLSVNVSSSLLAPLEEAIQIALREKGRQGDNLRYQRDLIDMTRLYLDLALNCHIAYLEDAFRAGNKSTFEQEAKATEYYLDNLEKLVSSWPDYRLQTQIDAAANQPERAGMPNDRWIRLLRVASTLEGYPADLDYEKCDYFELIKFYYRKRIEFYIKTLREKMAAGINKVSLDELEPTYRTIFVDWINIPFKVEEKDKFSGTPIEAVVAVFKAIEKGKDEFPIFSLQSYRETSPTIIADDKLTDFWSATGGFGAGTLSAPVVSDVSGIEQSGTAGLLDFFMKMVVKEGGSFRCWQLSHKFSPTVDWSNKDFFTFYWCGDDTGGVIYLAIAAPDDNNYVCTTFTDDFKGWKQLVFPLKSLPVHAGVPDWKKVGSIEIRPQTDNIAGTWYIDRVALDVAPGKKPKKVKAEEKKGY